MLYFNFTVMKALFQRINVLAEDRNTTALHSALMTKNPEVILNITYSHEVCFVCVYGKDVSLPKF